MNILYLIKQLNGKNVDFYMNSYWSEVEDKQIEFWLPDWKHPSFVLQWLVARSVNIVWDFKTDKNYL